VLILFDIDGTLLLSQGAGAKAMQEAGRRVVGKHFSLKSVPFAGRLDPLIWADGATLAGVEDPAALEPAFRSSYRTCLLRKLSTTLLARPLPGVEDLIASLSLWPGVTMGLVTGNYPETGRIKIEAAGLSMVSFPIQAWGTDGPDRRSLPRVAMDRYRAWAGAPWIRRRSWSSETRPRTSTARTRTGAGPSASPRARRTPSTTSTPTSRISCSGA